MSPQDFPDLPYIGLEDVEAHTSRILSLKKAAQYTSSAAQFYAGDVLYGRLRPYLNKVTRPSFDGLASAEFIVLPPSSVLDGDYLRAVLSSSDFVSFTSHISTGDRPRVDFSQIGAFRLALPPISEQRRIVAKLNTLLGRSNRAKDELAHIPRLIERYKQAVLEAAFCGDLTTDWRDEQSQSLEAWGTTEIGQLANVGTGATPKRGEKRYYEKGVYPWITSGALNSDYVDKAEEYITEAALRETNCRLYQPGTILVAMYGEGKTRGKASVLRIEAATNQACAAITLHKSSEVSHSFLWWFLKYNYANTRLAAAGGVQPNLNLSIIKAIKAPIPTPAEQAVLVQRLEDAFAGIQRLDTEVRHATNLSTRLKELTLAKAFRGELVPQDPADEPASVLLERIRAERLSSASVQRKKPGVPSQLTFA